MVTGNDRGFLFNSLVDKIKTWNIFSRTIQSLRSKKLRMYQPITIVSFIRPESC